MSDVGRGEVTRLLAEARSGRREAVDRLVPLLYGELRDLARRQLRREARTPTLRPTALVHEAYVNLLGGEWERATLADGAAAVDIDADELLALERALQGLEARQRQVVEYRFFGGLEGSEIAALPGVSERTVRRECVKARAWLYRALYPSDDAPPAPPPPE